MNLGHPDRAARLDALAAAYALGTLSSRSRRRLARLARADPAIAAAIREWEWRLAALADGVPEVNPPPRVWEGIRTRLGLATPGQAPAKPSKERGWRSLDLWRGLAAAGFAIAFMLGIALYSSRAPAPAESVVVVLAGQDAKPVLIATAERASRILTVKALASVAVPRDRALELWMLPTGRPPVSLGLVPASGVGRLPLREPAGVALQNIPALAVSLEPAGGSPTGAPTGPVLYTGSVERFY